MAAPQKNRNRPAGDRAANRGKEKTNFPDVHSAGIRPGAQPASCRSCIYFHEVRLPSGGLRRLCRFTGEKRPSPCREFHSVEVLP